jgi:CubicO group peptidase (beta-lactamase class C family)
MLLVDRGLVSLRDPVEAYLTGFKGGRGVLVRTCPTRAACLRRHIRIHHVQCWNPIGWLQRPPGGRRCGTC